MYCYNVQPGVTIDYATGDSELSGDSASKGDSTAAQNSNSYGNSDPSEVDPAAVQAGDSSANSADKAETAAVAAMGSIEKEASGKNTEVQDYVLNKNTKKFHYPWCSSADDIKKKNRKDFTGTREEVVAQGYDPCKRCNP